MNNIFDALEICLRELENGADMETVLARFPDLAGELHPILIASLKARSMSAPKPSRDAIRRGRARVLQGAAEMRQSRVGPRKRVIPVFQRLALSFTLAALLLLSGTGLLNASASALPGESLYPVKRTWEGLRLFLIFNEEAREHLEYQFENERLHEANELLVEGRHEIIQFAGIIMQVNGVTYVSGVPIILPAGMQLPANGAAVILSGRTNAQGFVEIITIELLPQGSVVPVGNPVEVELESDSGPRYYAMEGTVQAVSTTTLVINGLTVYLDNASIEGELCPGIQVEVKGYTAEDGRFIVTEVKAKGSCFSGSGDNGNVNSNSNSNTNDGSEVNGNTSNSNDDGGDSGSGGDDDGGDGDSDGGGGDGDDDGGD